MKKTSRISKVIVAILFSPFTLLTDGMCRLAIWMDGASDWLWRNGGKRTNYTAIMFRMALGKATTKDRVDMDFPSLTEGQRWQIVEQIEARKKAEEAQK